MRRFRRMVSRLETGIKITPPVDPPEFNRAPWHAMTVVFKSVKDEVYKPSDIITYIATNITGDKTLASTVGKNIIIKLQTVRIWGLAKQAINLNVTEVIGNGPHNMRQFTDLGSGINYSRLGYKYGTISRIDPLDINYTEDLFDVGGATETAPILVYIQVLYSTKSAQYVKLAPLLAKAPSLEGFEDLDLSSPISH